MSFFEKFFVNRLNRHFHKKVMADLEGALNLSGSSEVLEVGAGSGSFALLINERYVPNKLLLTDYHQDQVKLAEKNLQAVYGSVPTNFVLQRADALNLQFRDETFDSVFAFLVIHHFSKHEWSTDGLYKGLDEITRVLRHGGQFVYAETFQKRRIRAYLRSKGFDISHEQSYYFGITELGSCD